MNILTFGVLAGLIFSTATHAETFTVAQNPNPVATEEPGAKLLNDAVIKPKASALVLFRAGWCYQCKKMASNLGGAVHLPIIEIDADANPNLVRNYELKSLPTVILFSKGVQVDQKVGVMSESEIFTWMKKAASD